MSTIRDREWVTTMKDVLIVVGLGVLGALAYEAIGMSRLLNGCISTATTLLGLAGLNYLNTGYCRLVVTKSTYMNRRHRDKF